jgi:hypothetical protein
MGQFSQGFGVYFILKENQKLTRQEHYGLLVFSL